MHTTKPPISTGDLLADRYRIADLLGAGGMSWVFRAVDEHLDRPVALKVLRDVAPHHAGRLLREAQAVAALRHPAVVGIHDLGALDDGRPFIVLEFIPGQTLADRLVEGPLAPQEAVDLLRPAIAALAEAHAAGIVHRDLKPENLMLQPTSGTLDAVRVLDFGIAAIDPIDGEPRYTQTGAVFGTPEFMAPEQALGRRASPATDVWAMGAVLQTLITGSSPFAGSHAPEVLFKVVQVEPTPLPDHVPPFIAAVIEQCLRKAPEDRPTDAGALAQLLYAAAEPIPVATPLTPASPRLPIRLIAAASAGAGLLGFVLGLLLGGGDPPPTAVAQPTDTAPASAAPDTQTTGTLAPARRMLAENPGATLAWLDQHPEGDANARMLLRGRALLADRKTIGDGLDQIVAATGAQPDLLTPDLIPGLVDALDRPAGEPAQALLVKLWPASREALHRTAAEGNRRARWRAVEAIEAANGDAIAARKAALLRDLKVGSCQQRERAALALGKLEDPSVLPALRRANNRGLLDNICMGDSLDRVIYSLRKIEKARAADDPAP